MTCIILRENEPINQLKCQSLKMWKKNHCNNPHGGHLYLWITFRTKKKPYPILHSMVPSSASYLFPLFCPELLWDILLDCIFFLFGLGFLWIYIYVMRFSKILLGINSKLTTTSASNLWQMRHAISAISRKDSPFSELSFRLLRFLLLGLLRLRSKLFLRIFLLCLQSLSSPDSRHLSLSVQQTHYVLLWPIF